MAERIVIIGINYAPEHTGIAPYTTGMAQALMEQGWDVEVITGLPHYPQWSVDEQFRDHGGTRSIVDGVPVQRIRHAVPPNAEHLRRVAMELEFGWRAARAHWGRPDAVVLVSPALFASAIVRVRAAFQRTPVVAWVQDIYTAGIAETDAAGNMMHRLMRALEGRFLRSCSAVVVIHDRFAHYLRRVMNVAPDRLHTVRNWTHIAEPAQVDLAALRSRFGWRPEEIVVLHTGNMGAKQDLANVARAAEHAHSTGAPLRFVLVGGGHQRSALEQRAEELPLFDVLPSVDDETYGALLRAADILLVNERPGLTEMCVPSKLTSYFTAHRPVLAAVESESATAFELDAAAAGLRVPPGDPAALVAGAQRLYREWVESRGRRFDGGPRYVREVLSRSSAVAAFGRVLRNLIPATSASSGATATPRQPALEILT